jgi:hypothetical protein
MEHFYSSYSLEDLKKLYEKKPLISGKNYWKVFPGVN